LESAEKNVGKCTVAQNVSTKQRYVPSFLNLKNFIPANLCLRNSFKNFNY
jgi:hypothetical protein